MKQIGQSPDTSLRLEGEDEDVADSVSDSMGGAREMIVRSSWI